jgi:hypothetical protein
MLIESQLVLFFPVPSSPMHPAPPAPLEAMAAPPPPPVPVLPCDAVELCDPDAPPVPNAIGGSHVSVVTQSTSQLGVAIAKVMNPTEKSAH